MAKKVTETAGSVELIVVKQLPVIEDQLLAVKQSVELKTNEACSLVCTEDNYKKIKEVRSALNKEFAELEARRKEIKAQILEPYDRFEKTYKECVGDSYKKADMVLKEKIDEVETGIKAQKEAELEQFFAEYRESLGIPAEFVKLTDARIKVGLSDSKTSLRKQATEFLDRILADRTVIDSLIDRDEVLAEYANGFDLSASMLVVSNRHKMIEVERKRRGEAEEQRKKAREAENAVNAALVEAVSPPVLVATPPFEVRTAPIEKPEEKIYQTTFTVSGTIEQLKTLKVFLVEGGYKYEQR